MASTSQGGDTPATSRKGLTQEERDHLLVHHVGKLREQVQAVEKAREPLSAAQQELTARYNEAKADLGKGYTRKLLAAYVEDSMARARDLVAEERRRAHDKAVLGQPVFGMNGEGQYDFFSAADSAATPQAAKDEMAWEADGYLSGRRGAERKAPEGCTGVAMQAFLRGYDRGQDETQKAVAAAMEAKKRMSTPDAGAEPKNLNEPEPGTPEARTAVRDQNKRARQSLDALGSANQVPA